MKLARKLIDKLYGVKSLSKFKIIFETMDGVLFGTGDTTDSAPHIRDNLEIKRYMSFAIIALLPATLASIYFFGLRVIAIIAVSYIVGGMVEVVFAIIRKKEIHEGFLVTALVFPLILPPTVPLWVVAVGIAFGTIFGKEVFGGTGRNIFNPALVGRLFITISFPVIMTTSWMKPFADAITSATPLTMYKTTQTLIPYMDLLTGGAAGSLGEVFRIGIIIGGLFLMLTKVSNWRVPLSYIGTVFLLGWIGNVLLPLKFAPPLFQVLTGGLLFGAMFMATDPVTSPFSMEGKYIFGIGCGILTLLIRSFSGYVEGVMFSIVLMNAFTPIIDNIVLEIKFKPVKK